MSLIQGATIQGANILGRFTAMPNEFASLRMDLDFLDTGSITLDGSNNVETILDLTTENRDFTQSTSSFRPAFITGVGVQFNSDFLEHNTNFITDSTGTIIFVIRFDRVSAIDTIFAQGNLAVGDGDCWEFQKNVTNNVRSRLATGNSPGIGSLSTITDTSSFKVITIQKESIYIDSTQQDLIFYGSSPTTRWFNSIAVSNAIRIGNNVGTVNQIGRITLKRISYFNQALSNTDIIKLSNGLKNYYNI